MLVAAVIFAAVNYLANPHRPAWSEETLAEGEIALKEALALSSTALWADARSDQEYFAGHIPSALRLNEDRWDGLLPEFLSAWEPGQTVIVYCGSQQCRASHAVADRLRSEVGLPNVYVLKGGWEAWQKHAK